MIAPSMYILGIGNGKLYRAYNYGGRLCVEESWVTSVEDEAKMIRGEVIGWSKEELLAAFSTTNVNAIDDDCLVDPDTERVYIQGKEHLITIISHPPAPIEETPQLWKEWLPWKTLYVLDQCMNKGTWKSEFGEALEEYSSDVLLEEAAEMLVDLQEEQSTR